MVSSYLKDSKQKLELPNEFSWDMKILGEDGELWGKKGSWWQGAKDKIGLRRITKGPCETN